MRPIYLVLIAAAIAFGAGLGGSFHLDDYALFPDPAITSPSGWREVWRPLQTRPLTYFTFWVNYQLGGRNPAGYHAFNMALHLGAVWLLFATLRRVIPERAALIAAAIFALHPIQAEPVNYIFARGTLLAALFCLLSFRAWLDRRCWPAVGWFALALMSKEECVTFPFFLLFVAQVSRPAIASMLALSAAFGARILWATTVIEGSGAGAQSGIRPIDYFATQGLVILRYFRLLLIPYGFNADPDIPITSDWRAWLVWVTIAVAVALVWWKYKHGWWLAAGFVLLAPSSTILPAADLAADRRLYLPMVAFAAFAGLILHHLDRRIPILAAVVLAALSFGRTRVWSSEKSLWTEAVERSPHKLRPYIQLARASDPDTAFQLLEEAKKIAPNDPRPSSEKAMKLIELGRPDLALGEFGRALALAPRDPQAINNRGVALMMLEQRDAAIADFQSALRLDPCLPDALSNLKRLGIEASSATGRCRL